jgi:hypothetical protein
MTTINDPIKCLLIATAADLQIRSDGKCLVNPSWWSDVREEVKKSTNAVLVARLPFEGRGDSVAMIFRFRDGSEWMYWIYFDGKDESAFTDISFPSLFEVVEYMMEKLSKEDCEKVWRWYTETERIDGE